MIGSNGGYRNSSNSYVSKILPEDVRKWPLNPPLPAKKVSIGSSKYSNQKFGRNYKSGNKSGFNNNNNYKNNDNNSNGYNSYNSVTGFKSSISNNNNNAPNNSNSNSNNNNNNNNNNKNISNNQHINRNPQQPSVNNSNRNQQQQQSSVINTERYKVLEITRENTDVAGIIKTTMKVQVIKSNSNEEKKNPFEAKSDDIRVYIDTGRDNIRIVKDIMENDEVKCTELGLQFMEWTKVQPVADPNDAMNNRRKKRKVFTVEDLLGPDGIQRILHYFPKFQWLGPLYESKDLHTLIKKYKDWAFQLFPNLHFELMTKKIADKGKEKRVKYLMNDLRAGEKVDWNNLDLDKYEVIPRDEDFIEENKQDQGDNPIEGNAVSMYQSFDNDIAESKDNPVDNINSNNNIVSRNQNHRDQFPNMDEEAELFMESKYNDDNKAPEQNNTSGKSNPSEKNNTKKSTSNNATTTSSTTTTSSSGNNNQVLSSQNYLDDDFDNALLAQLDEEVLLSQRSNNVNQTTLSEEQQVNENNDEEMINVEKSTIEDNNADQQAVENISDIHNEVETDPQQEPEPHQQQTDTADIDNTQQSNTMNELSESALFEEEMRRANSTEDSQQISQSQTHDSQEANGMQSIQNSEEQEEITTNNENTQNNITSTQNPVISENDGDVNMNDITNPNEEGIAQD